MTTITRSAPLGAALLGAAERISGRRLPDELRSAWDALMQLFDEARLAGSVCINRTQSASALLERTGMQLETLEGALVDLGLLGGEGAPLVSDGERLYSARAYQEELGLARALLALARRPVAAPAAPIDAVAASLTQALGSDKHQTRAVRRALESNLLVISGGPGTGKTTSVVLMLECILAEAPDLRIALAAPTGKATGRMLESVRKGIEASVLSGKLPRMSEVLGGTSAGRLEARTLHKWLVTRTATGEKPSARNPLPCDVLVVDEASMVDVHLAARLFAAVSTETRVIILGDKHQLAAVGPGAVFADISSASGALAECVVELKTSRRFREGTVISRLARTINHEDVSEEEAPAEAVRLLNEAREAGPDDAGYSARWFDSSPDSATGLPPEARLWIEERLEGYEDALCAYCRAVRSGEAEHVLRKCWNALWAVWQDFRALAAQRRGVQSVEALNAYMEAHVRRRLAAEGLIDGANDLIHYPGRVVIVRRNDDTLGLYNGDVGITVPEPPEEPGGPERRVVRFGDLEGCAVSPSLLPEHDTAFAMTIHQSQGSEFKDVAVFLPADPASPLATRELLYTGVTRTKRSVTLFGSRAALEAAVRRPTERTSGLGRRLAEEASRR